MDGCDQQIYLNSTKRTKCARCELRGGPPPPRQVEARSDTGSDATRVKAYLKGMSAEERQYHIDNLRTFNSMLSDQWRQWRDELAEEKANQA